MSQYDRLCKAIDEVLEEHRVPRKRAEPMADDLVGAIADIYPELKFPQEDDDGGGSASDGSASGSASASASGSASDSGSGSEDSAAPKKKRR